MIPAPSPGEQLRADSIAAGFKSKAWPWLILRVLLYDSLSAVCLYRLSAFCAQQGGVGKIGAKLLRRFNHMINGCDISPQAVIGAGLYLPHPSGVVIGEGCDIGENVTIYQHVTIGRRHSAKHAAAYPVIKSGVIVFAGAVVAGGITIGASAVIGANAVLLQNVPDHCAAVGVPARIVTKPAAEP